MSENNKNDYMFWTVVPDIFVNQFRENFRNIFVFSKGNPCRNWYRYRKCTELFVFRLSVFPVHFPEKTRDSETVTDTHGLTVHWFDCTSFYWKKINNFSLGHTLWEVEGFLQSKGDKFFILLRWMTYFTIIWHSFKTFLSDQLSEWDFRWKVLDEKYGKGKVSQSFF